MSVLWMQTRLVTWHTQRESKMIGKVSERVRVLRDGNRRVCLIGSTWLGMAKENKQDVSVTVFVHKGVRLQMKVMARYGIIQYGNTRKRHCVFSCVSADLNSPNCSFMASLLRCDSIHLFCFLLLEQLRLTVI